MSAKISSTPSSEFGQSLGRAIVGGISSTDAKALVESAKQDLRAKPLMELLGYYSDVFGNQLTKLAVDPAARRILEDAGPALAEVAKPPAPPVEKVPGQLQNAEKTIDAFKSWFQQNVATLPADSASLKLDSLQAELAQDGTVFISGTFADAPNSLMLGSKLAWMFSDALALEHQGMNKAGDFFFAAETEFTGPQLL